MAEKCTIRDNELSQALEVSLQRIYDICELFDKVPDDKWELIEGEHFSWANQSLGQRRFSPEGAYEICKYINENEGRQLIRRFRRWLSGRDKKLKQLLVEKKFIEVVDSKDALIFVHDRAYMRPRYTRQLLGLGNRQDVLNKAFQGEIKATKAEPLQLEKHFIKDGDAVCLSGMGIARVSANLGATLTNHHRRAWCELVSQRVTAALQDIVEDRKNRKKLIQQAEERAKKAADKTCQITGERRGPANPINLAVHHVYDRQNYPHLADHPYNLIVIQESVHKDFHQWLGGNGRGCTVDDLERYIDTFSASLFPDSTTGRKHMSKALRRIEKIRRMVRPLA
ncbi:hypothetical protein VB780_08305 [Leptolyngbya sp. CCNP1308]|uniref:hypothetical protein n=1 Tax=Leptolyngbya sp. CCNP1308 TaxID=3110255 RepID=UPI002B2179A6|nr:hypothetical protein [Leptolyngbya sp. CCNP1308]MEA5448562.1 hypothetical protein [Leptolyngbya sp. CCNP1308]